jgi:hypothetical protein
VAGACRLGLVAFELFDAGGDLALEWNDVLCTHPGKRAFMVAVQVDKALESTLLRPRWGIPPSGRRHPDGKHAYVTNAGVATVSVRLAVKGYRGTGGGIQRAHHR